MFENYRRWAEQLIKAGVDTKSVTKPVEFIFQEARKKGIHLDFWQVCGAIWFLRKTQGGIGDRIHDGQKVHILSAMDTKSTKHKSKR